MSMERCAKCGDNHIDTDLDVECYVDVIDYGDDGATRTEPWCFNCRQRHEAELAREP